MIPRILAACEDLLTSNGLRISSRSEPERRGTRRTLRLWHNNNIIASADLYTRARFLHLYVTRDEEDGLTAAVAVPGLALWATLNPPIATLRSWLSLVRPGLETGVRVHLPDADDMDLWVHWRVHSPESSWSSDTPWWRDSRLNLHDLVLGRTRYSSKVLREQEVLIPLPEKSYRWKVSIVEHKHHRPRWPWPRVAVCGSSECLQGEQIPIPGKGENAWDLDTDAVFGLSCPAHSVHEAVGKVVGNIISTRLKRGWDGDCKPPTCGAEQ